jgi:cyclopropane fatty-acyl-phospholipid synthase-like methyltransferase
MTDASRKTRTRNKLNSERKTARKTARKVRHKTALTAKTADKLALYEASVQAPADEVAFIERTFRALRKRDPKHVREDFCASALFACEWVKSGKDRSALGLDLDAKVLAWAKKERLPELSEAESARIELREQDVLAANAKRDRGRFDACVAYNYSYCVFTTRKQLRTYFERAREALVSDGLLYLDLFGGTVALDTCVETTKMPGFTYVWEQASYNPIDASMRSHIHFRFKDGSRLDRAFTYEWRLWSMVELRELLVEAGFHDSLVYWEGADAQNRPNGVFNIQTTVENDPVWNAYIVALR